MEKVRRIVGGYMKGNGGVAIMEDGSFKLVQVYFDFGKDEAETFVGEMNKILPAAGNGGENDADVREG